MFKLFLVVTLEYAGYKENKKNLLFIMNIWYIFFYFKFVLKNLGGRECLDVWRAPSSRWHPSWLQKLIKNILS
jgi:hypothetical protein